MFKESADLRNPRMWNGKEWWWRSTKTSVKFNPGDYRRHLSSKCIGSSKKGRGVVTRQSGANKLNMEKSMAEVIGHKDDSEEHEHDKERK